MESAPPSERSLTGALEGRKRPCAPRLSSPFWSDRLPSSHGASRLRQWEFDQALMLYKRPVPLMLQPADRALKDLLLRSGGHFRFAITESYRFVLAAWVG